MKTLSQITLLAIGLLVGTISAGKDHCYAVTMAGGGTKGAYEAGALWGLIKNAPKKEEYAYDVVAGVSAGSINSVGVALVKIGEEDKMVEALSETWQ